MKVVGDTSSGPILPVWQSLKGFSSREPGITTPNSGPQSVPGIPCSSSGLRPPPPPRSLSVSPTSGRRSPASPYKDEICSISQADVTRVEPPSSIVNGMVTTPTIGDNVSITHKSIWDPLSSSTTSTTLSNNNLATATINEKPRHLNITMDNNSPDATNFVDLPIAKEGEDIEGDTAFR